MLFIEAGDFAIGLAFFGAIFEVVAFIDGFFAATDADFDFDAGAFPVEAEDDEGVAFDLGEGEEAKDFLFVEEESALAFGFVLGETGAGVGLDIEIVGENLAIFDASEGTADIGEAAADGFHFSTD